MLKFSIYTLNTLGGAFTQGKSIVKTSDSVLWHKSFPHIFQRICWQSKLSASPCCSNFCPVPCMFNWCQDLSLLPRCHCSPLSFLCFVCRHIHRHFKMGSKENSMDHLKRAEEGSGSYQQCHRSVGGDYIPANYMHSIKLCPNTNQWEMKNFHKFHFQSFHCNFPKHFNQHLCL